MSHQSGIRASEGLKKLFASAKSNNTRMIVIKISDEQLKEHAVYQKRGNNWQQDYSTLLPSLSFNNEPCYLLIKLDSNNSLGSDWLFVTYAPDTATVRQKMLYASTRSTLKSEFGPSYIKHDIQASTKSDVSSENLKHSCENKSTVLSFVEYDLMQAKLEESNPTSHGTLLANQAALKGVSFPIDQEALEKLCLLAGGKINYVQMSVDTLNEAIKLEAAAQVSIQEVQKHVPRGKPRYHFFAFDHEHDAKKCRPIFFVYTIPPSASCSIKDRMLYSSCKAAFLHTVETKAQLKVDRKIEVDSAEILNEDFFRYELYPRATNHAEPQTNGANGSGGGSANCFSKPQGPKNQRGNRRITKVEA